MLTLALFLITEVCVAPPPVPRQQPQWRPRLIVETDAGGDPDDEQSLVRFLLYSGEWDVEGIIANRAGTRRNENKNPEGTGLGIVRRLIQAYGECHGKLVEHDPLFPKPERLLEKLVAGYGDGDEGVRLVIAAVDAADQRPVWFLNWGTNEGAAASCLPRALDRILKERGEEGYARFKRRLRLICHDNVCGEHTTSIQPPFPLLVDTFRPALDGKRWYHRFSALTAKAGGFELERDLLTGHGPLGALYPTNTTHRQKEGDTMSFLYLVPTGMNNPEQPGWGSWAGRYGLNSEVPGRTSYWANQSDTWRGSQHRENTLARWAEDLQNDFRARLEWCVRPYREANHAPELVLNGEPGREILRLTARPGATIELDSSGTRDPDGQRLGVEWLIYSEAGTYRGEASLAGATSSKATLTVPSDADGKSIHVLLIVRDSGTPPLARYRRAVVECRR